MAAAQYQQWRSAANGNGVAWHRCGVKENNG